MAGRGGNRTPLCSLPYFNGVLSNLWHRSLVVLETCAKPPQERCPSHYADHYDIRKIFGDTISISISISFSRYQEKYQTAITVGAECAFKRTADHYSGQAETFLRFGFGGMASISARNTLFTESGV